MQVVIRRYPGKGAAALIDLLEKGADEVETLIGSVKGLVSYTIARSDNGGFTVTVCEDRAGIDESIQKAKDWIANNAANLEAAAPEVSIGDVIEMALRSIEKPDGFSRTALLNLHSSLRISGLSSGLRSAM